MKWHEKTWVIVLFLILFFPVGLVLVWKKKEWGSKRKVIITAIVGVCIVIGAFAPEEEEEASASANKVQEQAEVQVEEEKKESPEEIKQSAIARDKELFDMILQSEELNKNLLNTMNLAGQGQVSLLDLYDFAKQTKNAQYQVYRNMGDIDANEMEDYIEPSRSYVSNAITISEKIIKYIDKNEIKFLSEAKERIGYSETYTLKIIVERTKFLEKAGLTDEEVANVLNPPKE